MNNYVIATIKPWNVSNSKKLTERFPNDTFYVINDKECLNTDYLKSIHPRFIFFPHWSWIIPKEIYEKYECVVFHMTDLPFGRGGSPLQNLLSRGIYETRISAIKVTGGLDTGPVYMKEPVDISNGNADEILKKISGIVFERMIPRFLIEDLVPVKQTGIPVVFKRRTSDQSRIPDGLTQRQLYDFIRMLDGEGYPAAYLEMDNGKIYYRNARIVGNILYADAEFRKESGIE